MLKSVIAPFPVDEFLRDYWTRSFLHIPGAPDKFSRFYSWDALNNALEQHRFDAKRLKLFKSGKKIEPERYLTDRGVIGSRLISELSNGATLIFNQCEETWEPLRDLCIDLEFLFHTRVTVNLYAGWRHDNGFDVHWDDHDTIILQVYGRKRWQFWNPTRLHPFKSDVVDSSTKPSEEPFWDEILEPGGLFSIPRGYWHVAYPLDEPCMHLTVTVRNPTGIDLLHWLVDEMKSSELSRMALPVTAEAARKDDWLRGVHADLCALWDDTLLDRFIADRDANTLPRPRLSLPADPDPRQNNIRDTTLLELALPRPLRFLTEDGKTFYSGNGLKVPVTAGVAEKLCLFNDRLPHAIADLSPAPDPRLKVIVGVLVMNGILRRAGKHRVEPAE